MKMKVSSLQPRVQFVQSRIPHRPHLHPAIISMVLNFSLLQTKLLSLLAKEGCNWPLQSKLVSAPDQICISLGLEEAVIDLSSPFSLCSSPNFDLFKLQKAVIDLSSPNLYLLQTRFVSL